MNDALELVLKIFTVVGISSLAGVAAWFGKIRGYLKSSNYYFKRGDRLTNKNMHEKAVQWYDRALKKDPNFVDAIEQGAKSKFAAKRFVLAEHTYSKAIALLEERTQAVADTMRLIWIYKKHCKDEPGNPSHVKELRECHLFLIEHKTDAADYKKLAECYGWRARCRANDSETQLEQAEEDVTAALAIHPGCAVAHFVHGRLLMKAKDYQGAIDAYTQAIKFDPEFAMAYNNRGFTFFQLKNYDQVIADCTAAIRLEPKHILAHLSRGWGYFRLLKYEEAIFDFSKAIKLDPKEARAYNGRGSVYFALEKYEKAIQDFTKAVNLNPKHTLAYINRAEVYNAMNQSDLAADDQKTADGLINKKLDG